MTVVKHGSVHYSFMIFGKMFQILVVGSDDSECSFLVETFQYSFGNSTSDLRLRTSTELVNQDEAPFVTALHHDFHIGQVRRVGTQIIFNRLLITNIDKDATEYTGMTTFVHCSIYCSKPTVFKQTDLPPAFGPDIIRIRCF